MSVAPGEVLLIDTPAGLAAAMTRAARAERVALDVESNGLHAFRAGLCVVQLAWPEDGLITVAVVDPLVVPVAPMGPLLGDRGPVKVLHDLTFDARLLAEAGVPIARARDTSVAARLLGHHATGLATLLGSELGHHVDKRLQQHDWARRPLGAGEIAYLAGDVRHLLALDAHLERAAEERDLGPEIDEECAYKLRMALAPPRDPRPGYVKAKGAAALDAPGRAALRRLWLARDAAAEAADVPPFKIVSSETLVELAGKRPETRAALAAVHGATSGQAGRHVEAWLRAIAEGARDGDVPASEQPLFAPAPPDREAIARRRGREAQVTGWRKAEAARRGLDEQAVLPGHCAQEVVDALLQHDARPDPEALREALARVPGLGARRLSRYGDALAALAASPPAARRPA
jgi:ribonuclease D